MISQLKLKESPERTDTPEFDAGAVRIQDVQARTPWANLLPSLLSISVLVPATGYLVDMFDLFLFNMVRVKSLHDLGLTQGQITQTGMHIVNAQLGGIIVGAYLCGVLADRWGRKTALLSSILLYSFASILTAFVQADWMYAILRFITGVGLAGEVGAGIALISEKFSDRRRGLGIGLFIIFGFFGVLFASALVHTLSWRTCYIVGGLLGLSLLTFRMLLKESSLFKKTRTQTGFMFGGLKPILINAQRRAQYISAVMILLPSVFIPQIIWTLSPEIAQARGISDIDPAQIIGLGYGCVIVSDLLAIAVAEKIKNRKQTIVLFSLLGCVTFSVFMWAPIHSRECFYLLSSCLGITFGMWVVAASMVAEMFGTNVRATAATTIPNFARGCAIVMNTCILSLKPVLGIQTSIAIIGIVLFSVALVGLSIVKDAYGRNLDFIE